MIHGSKLTARADLASCQVAMASITSASISWKMRDFMVEHIVCLDKQQWVGSVFFFFGESHGPRGVFRSHHWMVKNSLKDLRFFFRGPHINLFGGLELHSCLFVAWTFDGWCFWFFGITCWEQGHMLDCKLLQFIFMLHHCGTFWKCAWAIAFDIVHRVYAYASWINTYCSTQYLLQIRHKFGLLFVHPQL